MSHGWGLPWSTPYYAGTPTSSEVPGKYPIGLNGTGYFLDTQAFSDLEARSTVPVLRAQADQSNVPSLASLNPEDLWRRDVESWHHGAGQVSLDRQESDGYRFRSSKGLDCWTKWELSLLPDTEQARSSANTNLRLAAAGSRLYVTDGATLRYTTDVTAGPPASWTSVTGYSATDPSSIASDGFQVYTANGADGCYRTDTSTGAATKFVTDAVASDAVIAVVKARLMLGTSNSLYNITNLTGPAALPTVLFTHQNSAWKWTGFAEGPSGIYASGFAGDKSLIYFTTIKADATGLDAPIVAGELPDGEVARSIQGYLGYLLIGTDSGVRLAQIDESSGVLRFGRLISTGTAVYCFEPQDRFVWFGWTNYDDSSTGLGRVDLSVFTDAYVPAYASDLMVTGSGTVQSVVTFGSRRVFTVSGSGVWVESADLVASGTLDSGVLTYGLVDDKIAVFANVRTSSLPAGGTYSLSLSADGDSFTTIGVGSSTNPTMTFNCSQAQGEKFELRVSLTRATDTTTAPVVSRVTLRSFPSVKRGEQFLVPILLAEEVASGSRTVSYITNLAETRRSLFDLALTPQLVRYQEGTESVSVMVKDVSWRPSHKGKTGWNGTATLRCLSVRE